MTKILRTGAYQPSDLKSSISYMYNIKYYGPQYMIMKSQCIKDKEEMLKSARK